MNLGRTDGHRISYGTPTNVNDLEEGRRDDGETNDYCKVPSGRG